MGSIHQNSSQRKAMYCQIFGMGNATTRKLGERIDTLTNVVRDNSGLWDVAGQFITHNENRFINFRIELKVFGDVGTVTDTRLGIFVDGSLINTEQYACPTGRQSFTLTTDLVIKPAQKVDIRVIGPTTASLRYFSIPGHTVLTVLELDV